MTGGPVLRAPARIRGLVRASELGLILVAAVVGAASGALVTGIGLLTQAMHTALFGLPSGMRLSEAATLDPVRTVAVPALGGACLALVVAAVARWRRRNPVDPIEANALHGGRMSVVDSVLVTVQTIISNGFGASVGLEAGYTQASAAVGSRLGLGLEMRRADLRTLVGCGAAAAIATAFDAPLTGAFYGFELIIGVYSIATLTPVVVAALVAVFVSRALVQHEPLIDVATPALLGNAEFVAAAGVGLAFAGYGVLLMLAVTAVETSVRTLRIPALLRPVLGGLAVGGLALLSPQVLSAGHGAFRVDLSGDLTAASLLALAGLKSAASAISLGSGFRGGLFFAALLVGALGGKMVGLLAAGGPFGGLDPSVYAMIGMSALAVAVVGGPLTMTFLALEMTGDFRIAVLVLVAVIVSSLTVRKTFGYSFTTWRFHLRGESIRSAHDVGWLRNLTVGQMMRRDVRTVREDTAIAALRRDFPPGSTQRVMVVDNAGRYAGIVLVPEAHSPSLDGKSAALSDILRYRQDVLRPAMTVKDAMAVFDRSESEALAVVDPSSGQVLGMLTESHALKRYSEELDRRRRDIVGED